MPKYRIPITDRDEMTREVATWQAGGTATVRHDDGCEVTGPLRAAASGAILIGDLRVVRFCTGAPGGRTTALVAYDPPPAMPEPTRRGSVVASSTGTVFTRTKASSPGAAAWQRVYSGGPHGAIYTFGQITGARPLNDEETDAYVSQFLRHDGNG